MFFVGNEILSPDLEYYVYAMQERTDEEIALRVQNGDIDAFGSLVERYEEKIIRYAKRFLLDREDCKDLAQEVFVKAYMNIRGFDTAKRFSPWVYRIAHNEFINAIKKRSRIKVFSFDPDIIFPHPFAEETADGETEKKELQKSLGQSLEKLDPKYREPLILRYFEDMSYEEIAEVLQIPAATVGVRLSRGRALLRDLIKI